MNWHGFDNLRRYERDLQNDLRKLERWLLELSERISSVETPSIFSDISSSATYPLVVAYGGTGLSSWTAGDMPYYVSGTALSKLAIGASGTILRSNGSVPAWVTAATAGLVSGTGTTNTLTKWTSTTALGDSGITDDGATLASSRAATWTGTHTFSLESIHNGGITTADVQSVSEADIDWTITSNKTSNLGNPWCFHWHIANTPNPNGFRWSITDGGGGFIDLMRYDATIGSAGQLWSRDFFGVMQPVVLESRSIATGTGLTGGGDFSAQRTHSIDQTANLTWTGNHVFQPSSGTPTLFVSGIDLSGSSLIRSSSTSSINFQFQPVTSQSTGAAARIAAFYDLSGDMRMSLRGDDASTSTTLRIGADSSANTLQMTYNSGGASTFSYSGSTTGLNVNSTLTFVSAQTFNGIATFVGTPVMTATNSNAATGSTGLTWNTTAGTRTGGAKAYLWQDGSTDRMWVNANGHLVLNNQKGLYAAYGLDDTFWTSYANAFQRDYIGNITTGNVLVWIGTNVKNSNNTAGSLVQYGTRIQCSWQPNTTGANWNSIIGGTYAADVNPTWAASSAGAISSAFGGEFLAQLLGNSSATSATTVTNAYGGWFHSNVTGYYYTLIKGGGAYISVPSISSAHNLTITDWDGIYIEDQTNSVPTNVSAIRIASQTTSGGAAYGNIKMVGGNWNTGHIQLGSGHIWYDGTDLRGKNSAPTSASDGGEIVLGTGQVYTPSNVTTTRSFDADDVALDVYKLADVLGTLIADLQTAQVIA